MTGLEALSRQVTGDPFFLGQALAVWASSEGLDDAGLAARLGVTPETLVLLRLCRRPHPEPDRFRADVERIAARFGVSADRLAEIVRRADALERLGSAGQKTGGLLIAARDRPDAAEDEPEGP